MLAKTRKKCARLVGKLLEQTRGSKMPAEVDARRTLILRCAICGKCRITPS